MSNCANCPCIRTATSVTTAGLITLDNNALGAFQPFCFLICSWCSPQPTVAMTMNVNGNNVPLWDRYGRPVYSDQIQGRKVYKARFVQEGTPHVTVCNVCPAQCCARTTAAAASSSSSSSGSTT